MSQETKNTGLTRRDFVKTVGLAGLAVAGAGVPAALAAPAEPAAGAAPAGTVPNASWAKPGSMSPSSTWEACSTPSTINYC